MRDLSALDRLVEAQLTAWAVPGLALGILEAGETTLRGYGVASLDGGAPVTPETSFRIASITKPMVGTLCLELGLPLDEPVWEDVTLRHALAHRTGLDGEPDDPLRFGDGDDATEALVGELGTLRRWFPAGGLWSYQNAGYWLAGREAARANGSTFEAAMEERIFEPLGMTRTGFDAPDAAGHEPDGSPADGRYARARRPSGGVVSTVGDLLRFAQHHFDRRETHEPQTEAVGGEWALGWGRTRGTVYHPGSWGGYESLLLVRPERRFALGVLSNGAGGWSAYTRIVDALLGRRDPPRVEADAAGLAGRYERKGAAVEVEASDGGLLCRVTEDGVSQPQFWGYAISERTFFVPEGAERSARFDFPRPGFARVGSRLAARA